jgi:asparaginyl-tRNA synthetase
VIRGETATKILKFRSFVLRILRDYFDSRDIHEVSPPLIVKSQCEGGSTVFNVDYFGEKV